MRDRGNLAMARAFDRVPKIVRHRVAEPVRADIGAHAVAPSGLADIILQHRDDRFTLVVGDRVERLAHLVGGADVLHDRMGGAKRIEPHRALAPVDAAEQRLPLRVDRGGGLGLHPRGEALVQPDVVPPGHGDQIAEPLVRHFVRGDDEDVLPPPLAGDRRIVEQHIFEREDRAPILHRAEKLAGARAGDVVELRQREGRAEIVVVIRQDPRRALERPAALLAGAATADHADFGVAGARRDPIELAGAQEQQVGGHGRRGLEGDEVGAVGLRRPRRGRHVADRLLAARHDDAEIIGGAELRLVPAGEEAARVARLELGEERALVRPVRLVIEREEARGLGVDLAVIVDGELVAARRKLAVEMEGDGLVFLVLRGRGRMERRAVRAGQRHRAELHVDRVQRQAVGRLQHRQVDPLVAGEGEMLGVRRDPQRIVDRARGARQLARHVGADRRHLRGGRLGGGRRRDGKAGGKGEGGGEGGETHPGKAFHFGIVATGCAAAQSVSNA